MKSPSTANESRNTLLKLAIIETVDETTWRKLRLDDLILSLSGYLSHGRIMVQYQWLLGPPAMRVAVLKTGDVVLLEKDELWTELQLSSSRWVGFSLHDPATVAINW